MHGFSQLRRASTAVITASLLVIPALAQGERPGEQQRPPSQGERQPGGVPQGQGQTGQTGQTGVRQQTPSMSLDRALINEDKLIGAKVYTMHGGAQVRDQEKLGTISDLVIDGKSGKVRYGVLATGGTMGLGKTNLAVRWEHLAWKDADECFRIALDEEALRKLPKFDPKFVDSLATEAEGAMDRIETGIRDRTDDHPNRIDDRDDIADAGAQRDPTQRDPNAQRDDNPARPNRAGGGLLLASKIEGGEVSAQGEDLGETEDLLIDPDSGQVVFVTVASGGVLGLGETKYVVPWSAMSFNESAKDKDEVAAVIQNKNKAAFETAPKLSDKGDLNKADFRSRVFSFYGVQPPDMEAQPATPPSAPPREGAMPPSGRDR